MFYKERERHPLSISNPALLIVDVQNYFFQKHSPAYISGSERVLLNIERLVNALRKVKIPIIATIHEGGNSQMFKWWNNTVDKIWTELMINQSSVDYILKKNTYDAFYNTDLENILSSLSIDQLLITGVMTHLCCETTARSGFVRGYDIVMIEDCLWDKDEWYHYSSLKNLAHGFAAITTSEEIIKTFLKY